MTYSYNFRFRQNKIKYADDMQRMMGNRGNDEACFMSTCFTFCYFIVVRYHFILKGLDHFIYNLKIFFILYGKRVFQQSCHFCETPNESFRFVPEVLVFKSLQTKKRRILITNPLSTHNTLNVLLSTIFLLTHGAFNRFNVLSIKTRHTTDTS